MRQELVVMVGLDRFELLNAGIPTHLREGALKDHVAFLTFSETVKHAYLLYLYHLETRVGEKSLDKVRADWHDTRPEIT